MYKSCSYCGRIHPFNYICDKKPKKYKNKQHTKNIDFRSTYKWQKKREQIKERDLYMCVICSSNLKENKDKAFNDLEVHHIESLDNAYDLFNPLMTKRGEDIDISSIKITKSKDKYSAIIDDYNVSTKIEDNMVKELKCSCTYKGYCKHQYALIKKIKK